MGGALIRAVRRREQPLTLAAAGVILVGLALLPLLWLLGASASEGGRAFGLLAAARPWALLLRSVLLASGVTLVAVALGAPLGVLIARTDLPGRRALWLLHAFPLALPPFLLALGWFYLLGRAGVVGTPVTAQALFSTGGAVVVMALCFTPVVTSLVALGVLGVDASLEEAARVVARPWRVATRILLPAARPGLVLAAIVVFALAFSELGVPMFLRVEAFPAAVFSRLGGIDYAPGEAFALVLPLVPLALVLLALERRFAGAHAVAVAGLRGLARTPLPLGRWRTAATGACWAAVLVALLPLVALALRAGARGFAGLPQWIGWAPANSLLVAAVAATVIAVLGLVVGHAAARRLRGAAWLDGLAVLAFVMPAAVLGVGLIAVWNRPATTLVYGSVAILVVGAAARYAAIGVRTVAVVVAQSPLCLEEAAATTGARFGRRLLRVVLPVNRRGVFVAWLLALVFCLRDLETAVLFYPPGSEPLPVRIFTLEANGPPAVVAALALVHVALTAAALAAGAWLLPRRRPA